jgi:argininosuccinate lyase
MKIWQKNYTVNEIIEHFTIGEDKILDLDLARYDVLGTMAHIQMLHKIGLLDKYELKTLHNGLLDILREIDAGKFTIQEGVEDIHSQVEITLTSNLGDSGKKIHSGRSRNDQVLLDLKLFMRHNIAEIVELATNLFNRLINLSEMYKHILMPGYTHFQIAMPSSFGIWFGGYAESLTDDLLHLKAAFEIINQNPLGSAAGYGTSFPLDRQLTTELLGFDRMNYNVVYAQMGRGKVEKILAISMGLLADTVGKLAADICLYMGQNFGFFSFPDEYTTGSSIMPHKKNPDVFELIRGKCNKINAISNEISLITSNLPAGYHRDMQLLKENLFDGMASLKACLYMMEFMLTHIKINDNIIKDDKYKYIFSVEKVNELVLEGWSFRDAYRKVGEMIEAGTFQPDHVIHHTHEGSIGNLCNDKIIEKMDGLTDYFSRRFEFIHTALDKLTGEGFTSH